jgi:hypothetical protein
MDRQRQASDGLEALPPRVAGRPDPAQWGEDELMSLTEAAHLFWPQGPIRPASLRTAQRDGQLAVARIAGKVLTTRGAVEAMIKNTLRATARPTRSRTRSSAAPASGRSELRAKIEALVAPKADGSPTG